MSKTTVAALRPREGEARRGMPYHALTPDTRATLHEDLIRLAKSAIVLLDRWVKESERLNP
jgi:hypothetical protein